MNTLKDYVNFRLTHADKVAEAEGYPLILENCKKYKPMRDLMVYGNSVQAGTPTPDEPIELQSVGKLVTDTTDVNYGKYKIPIVQRGINLFDKNKVSPGYINDANGEYKFVADGSTYASDYIEIPPNQKFYITHTPTHQWAAAYDENKQFVKGMYGYGSAKTMPSNAKYIRITIKSEYIDTMQVQLGTTATPYEPYVEPIITNIFLDEPLRKIGDYADYIDFKENKVVRRNKEVIPKPEDITYAYKSYASRYGYYIYGTGTKYPDAYTVNFNSWGVHIQPEKSTHFIANNAYSVSGVPGDWYIQTGIRFLLAPEFQASDGVSSTFDDIRAWMQSEIDKGTPLKFTYRLAEPTEEPLNMELPKLTAKTSIIEVDTSLTPSNTYGKYIKR